MTDLHSKRKFAGPPISEKRKTAESTHIPPHKKPRDYVLIVEWAEAIRYRDVTAYPSKAARAQARLLIEKKLAEHKYFGGWRDRKKSFMAGPVFTEVLLTDEPAKKELPQQNEALQQLEALFKSKDET